MATKKWSVKGKVIDVMPIRKGSTDKGEYAFQEFVVNVEDEYPFNFLFAVYGQDKINQYRIENGDVVEVFFNISARQWKDKWITTIRAWKVNNLSKNYQNTETSPAQGYSQPAPQPQKQESKNEANDVNNLPF